MINNSTGTKSFSDFGHGNDTEVEYINDTLTLFVLTSTKSNGSLEMTKLCTLNYDTAYVNGTAKDTSQYSLQGIGYYDKKLYLPLSGHTVSDHENISIILVYDLEGASGTITPDPDLTFCITSSAYSAYFEVESCEISPKDGRMYFSANRRVSSSVTNHDGVSYISNWTYDPSTREGGVQNYRWELQNNELVSTTNGGNVFNGIYQMEGSISNGTITNGRFVLSKPVVLEHNQPWIWNGRHPVPAAPPCSLPLRQKASGRTSPMYSDEPAVLLSPSVHMTAPITTTTVWILPITA